jgi:single-stranded DNA-binding protein
MDNKISKEEKEKKEITLSGHLGADAKLGESKNEKKSVLTFSIADNSEKDSTKWHNVQIWDKNIPAAQLKKGDIVELTGYFKTFESKNGPAEEFIANKVTSHNPKIVETFKGNLGQDPVIKEVNGKQVAAFSIGKNNGDDTKTWQNVQVWNEGIEKNKITELKKGDFVELKGHFGKEYQNKAGETKRDLILEETKIIMTAEKLQEKKSNGIKM